MSNEGLWRHLCDGSANGGSAGLGDLVGLQGAHDAIRGEEENRIMVHALHHILNAVIPLQLGALHACIVTVRTSVRADTREKRLCISKQAKKQLGTLFLVLRQSNVAKGFICPVA